MTSTLTGKLVELRTIAKERGIIGVGKMKKAELMDYIQKKSIKKEHVKIRPPRASNKKPKVKYQAPKLDVDLYPAFMSRHKAKKLYEYFETNYDWSDTRRCNYTLGDEGLVYKIRFYEKTIVRPTQPWDDVLDKIRKTLEGLTGEVYNVCVIQRYPSGKFGIKPHRDKEMVAGTKICGLSLGETRILSVERNEKIEIPLNSGSLYVFNPPTNDYYTHCIETDETTKPRISLTFRNYI